jgi:hypothetical protein
VAAALKNRMSTPKEGDIDSSASIAWLSKGIPL